MLNIKKYYEEIDNIIKFILDNSDLYENYDIIQLINFMMEIPLLEEESVLGAVLPRQILAKFNIIEEEYNDYLNFYRILNSLGFIKGNCLEVGSGPYPILAEIIRKNQLKNNYHLTICESAKVINLDKDIKVIRNKFTQSTDITDFDTIFGLYPCEASIDMTIKGIEENKNLAVAFCDCDHSTPEFPRWFGEYWAIDFCFDIKERYGDKVEIIEWTPFIREKHPILVHRKK